MAKTEADLGEGAQALFCFVADVLGSEKTNQEFEQYLNKVKSATEFFNTYEKIINRGFSSNAVKTTNSKESIIKYIEENSDWFLSSLTTAQYIINEIDDISSNFSSVKQPGWQDLFYRHGDNEVMGVMKKLFETANAQSAKQNGEKFFNDVNKWSPADIYFASDKARTFFNKLSIDKETKNNNLTFAVLNQHIGDMIESADLLPLSLKKVVNNIMIKKVNFSRDDEEKLLADTVCTGVQKWEPKKGSFKISKNNFQLSKYSGGRDINLTLNSGNTKGKIQIRHLPTSKGKPQKVGSSLAAGLNYTGASAAGGKITTKTFFEVVRQVDPKFASRLKDTWYKSYPKFTEAANQYIEYGGGNERYKSSDKMLKAQFNNDIGAISGITLMNDVRKLIDDYFKNPKERQHNVVRAIFAYTASRTINSSPFVIAKD